MQRLWYLYAGVDATLVVVNPLVKTNDGDIVALDGKVTLDANADFAYTVHREITSTSVNGAPRDYVLRVTQVYRREDGTWKVVHRHADEEPDAAQGP